MTDVSSFIQSNTSGGAPSCKFKQLGDNVTGTVVRSDIVERPNISNPTGDKVKTLVITLDVQSGVEDSAPVPGGSTRSLWIKPSQQLQALSAAMKDSGASTVEIGDQLKMEYYGTEPTNLSPKKLFRAAYKQSVSASSAPAFASSAPSADDLI